jgi:rare lipoprotein A
MSSQQRRIFALIAGLALVIALGGCASDNGKSSKLDPFAGKGSPYYRGSGPVPKGGGRYQLGSPYQVAGQWFTPREQPDYDKTGLASWYGEAFHRRQTSNGEYFDMAMLSAAHATLPLPSYAKVTNLENGRSVIVRINDRGPFVDSRVIDLSKGAAEVLGYKRRGMAKVRVQYVGPAPLDDRGSHLAMMNKRLNHGAGVRALAAAARKKPEPERQVAAAQIADQGSLYQQASTELKAPARRSRTGYVVSVATFENADNAEAARDGFSADGPAQVFEIEGMDGPLYLLQLGPFRSELGARQALAAAVEAGFPGSKISSVKIQAASAKP